MYSHQTPIEQCFVGSIDKIEEDKARVSEFRRQHGMSPDPFGAIVGSPDEVAHKQALLRSFKRTL